VIIELFCEYQCAEMSYKIMCFGEYDSTDACDVLCAEAPSYLLAMFRHLRSGLYTFNLQVSRASEDEGTRLKESGLPWFFT